jgi:hypothetical protein
LSKHHKPFQKLLALAALAALLLASPVAAARADQDDFIKRAVFSDGVLWLLTDDGRLSTIRPGEGERLTQTAPGKVTDICLWAGGNLTALVFIGGRTNAWKVYGYTGHGFWGDVLNGKSGRLKPDENLRGLACRTDSRMAAVLTTHRLGRLTLDETGMVGMHFIDLKARLGWHERGPITATYVGEDATLVGFNAGEWGGGLYRIDNATGELKDAQILSPAQQKAINSARAPEPDDGAADKDEIFLGNINGIEPESGNPGCFIIAQGVVHFGSSGRLAELCNGKARTFYSKVFKDSDNAVVQGDQTIAFFSLARVGEDLWAAGIDGLYRFKRDGGVDFRPMPKFHKVGGVWVNFDDPHLALVITEINERTSVSNGAPLLVPH